MSDVIFLSDVRISFPHLVEPQKQTNAQTGKERISYNGDFIMPPNHPGYQAFMKRYGELAVDKWKEHAQNAMTMIHADRKQRCYGAGEEKINKKTFVPYDGYAGNVYISASRDTPPQVIQADGKPIDPANTMAYQQLTRKIYGGCRVNVAIKPWIQANAHGNGIRCDLVAIQFLRDDTAFGEGVVDASGMFGQVAQAAQAAAPTGAGMPGMPAAPFPGAAPAGIPGLPPFMSGQ
jgi:hypothetical protein